MIQETSLCTCPQCAAKGSKIDSWEMLDVDTVQPNFTISDAIVTSNPGNLVKKKIRKGEASHR